MSSWLHPQPQSSSSGLSGPNHQLPDAPRDYTDATQPNPWAETRGEESTTKRALPTVLRPGNAPKSTEEARTDKELPDIPNWGQTDAVTPRSSSESERSRDFWEDDEEDETNEADAEWLDKSHGQDVGQQIPDYSADQSSGVLALDENAPGNAAVKRKPVADSSRPLMPAPARSLSGDFASNNPFRQPRSPNGLPQHNAAVEEGTYAWAEQPDAPSSPRGKGKEVVRDPPVQGTPLDRSSYLSVDDRSFGEFAPSYRPSTAELDGAYRPQQQPPDIPQSNIPPHPSAPPPPIPATSAVDEQSALIPVSPKPTADHNPWASGKQNLSTPPASLVPGSMVDRVRYHLKSPGYDQGQEIGVVSIKEPPQQASSAGAGYAPPTYEDRSRDDSGPPLPQRPGAKSLLDEYTSPEHPPPKPQRPTHRNLLDEPDDDIYAQLQPQRPPRPVVQSTPLDEATQRRLAEQRTETYQIKHFNWFDHNTRRLRRSSMLTQNKNGPCPLLALVNALIMSQPEDSESAQALQAREQVSLGLLIESLMDELTSERRQNSLQELPDVDELTRFLLKLHTGMNANPRFVAPDKPQPNLMDARNSVLDFPSTINDDRKPGTFEQTQDMALYGAFSVPLVHGWLPQRSDPARAAFTRAAPTYEDAQTVQFGEEELEGKLSQGGLTPNEQQLWEDIVSIRRFFATYPTQLTPYGLNVVSESLYPGAFAIMFRNDHFSTIYKHPETGQLYTLVTDAGYADKDEVIWESLVDVSGQRSEFFSGDFRPVGNVEDAGDISQQPSTPISVPSGNRRSSTQHLEVPLSAPPISPQEIQEQHDADFAMALQLQEEEEARANPNRRRSAQARQSNSDQRSSSNIPIRLRSQGDVGPAIPPRVQRNPGVNRPGNTTDLDDEAPPLYEEAVKSPSYIPPPGHPQHPSSDPSPRSSTAGLGPATSRPNPISPVTSNIHASASAPRRPSQPVRVPQQRRMSAFQENAQTHGYLYPGQRGGGPAQGPRLQRQQTGQKGEDKDCVVM